MLVLDCTGVKPLELLSISHPITLTWSTSSYMKSFWKLCPWTIPGLLLASPHVCHFLCVWQAFLCSDRQNPSSVAMEQLEPGSWRVQHHKDKAVLGEDWLNNLCPPPVFFLLKSCPVSIHPECMFSVPTWGAPMAPLLSLAFQESQSGPRAVCSSFFCYRIHMHSSEHHIQKTPLAPHKRRHWDLKTRQVIQEFLGGG